MIMKMQHTYEEQQLQVESMIRQVTLLTEMMKEMTENQAKSEVTGSIKKEEEVKGAEEESEALLNETVVVEIGLDEEEAQDEEKSMTSPPDEEAPKESLKEARDGPQEKDKTIDCEEGVDNTLFYLQTEEVHEPEEKVKEFTTVVKEERIPAKRPPPLIDQSEGCCYEEEKPEGKEEERSRRKAARSIYWVQLQPWPEP